MITSRNFSRTYREIVFVDICSKMLNSSIRKPKISVNQIALRRKSWLYARGIFTSAGKCPAAPAAPLPGNF